MDRFHARHQDVALLLNVTRYPYSFLGDDRSGGGSLKGAADGDEPTETWHDALLGYMGNDPRARAQAEEGMSAQVCVSVDRELGRGA